MNVTPRTANGAPRSHLHIVAGRPMSRPPATPDEIEDNPHADVFYAIGWVAAALLLGLIVGLIVAAVFSLVPVKL